MQVRSTNNVAILTAECNNVVTTRRRVRATSIRVCLPTTAVMRACRTTSISTPQVCVFALLHKVRHEQNTASFELHCTHKCAVTPYLPIRRHRTRSTNSDERHDATLERARRIAHRSPVYVYCCFCRFCCCCCCVFCFFAE